MYGQRGLDDFDGYDSDPDRDADDDYFNGY
jgi:hypothetical protein